MQFMIINSMMQIFPTVVILLLLMIIIIIVNYHKLTGRDVLDKST